VVAIVVLAGFVLRTGATGRGGFEMTAYQGASEFGGSAVVFNEVKALATGKPIVLNFWGGTCPPCEAEMPGFQRIYERHQDDFLMIGLDGGPFMGLGTRNSALQLLDDLGITYPAAFATSREPIVNFGATGLPTTFFFDADGELVDQRSFMNEQTFESILTGLIGATAVGARETEDA
jgi:thiol-disulfide isomerase/thioredoxin